MEKVELHAAFTYCCTECGRDNFVRAVAFAPESLMIESATLHFDDGDAIDLDMDDLLVGGNFYTAPSEVTCPHCGSCFEAFEVGEGRDDGEEGAG